MSGKHLLAGLLSLCIASAAPVRAAGEEPLVNKVKDSIDKGIAWLRKEQKDRGGEWSWENTGLALVQPGGTSALAMLALLTAGVKPSDPAVKRGMAYMRRVEPQHVYVVGIQTMVFEASGDARDLDLIQRNVDWLLEAMIKRGGKCEGWAYSLNGGTPDNSNTQYALLGLWAGKRAGAKIPKDSWELIQDYYLRSQGKDGRDADGWSYHSAAKGFPTQTMTAAGVSGLLICAQELNNDKQGLDEASGVAKNCGKYDENDAVARGLRWLGTNFSFKTGGHSFYNIYGIERVGRLSGQRFVGEHDWYREGCEILVGLKPQFNDLAQRDDGSWKVGGTGADAFDVISTSFALLFLSKGRTPILISKLAYNAANNDPLEWNRKHHDARHLVEYASRELFKNEPLAWQVFDPRPADLTRQAVFDDELIALLQSPILYMNGHKAPRLTPAQEKMLKRYVEEGGFILAEACCGDEEFAKGFRQLMKDMFPDTPLQPLSPDHPVWSAHALVKPSEFRLEGIESGCKTVVMFSPQPLAGYWEESRFEPKPLPVPAAGRGQTAYRLAGNIIAYATGMELPKQRLTREKLTDTSDIVVPRHALKIGQLRHTGDAEPARAAMRNLAMYMRDTYRLDVDPNKEMIAMSKQGLSKFKFLYMHGRRQFDFDDDDLKNLRFNLEDAGGLLLADACCGQKAFDRSFREFAKKLFPTHKLETIPLDDYLYSDKLNGEQIRQVKRRTENSKGELESLPPALEGIKVDGRWAVIYSRYDLGCALEKNKSSACIGHDEASAKRLAGAAMLYALKR